MQGNIWLARSVVDIADRVGYTLIGCFASAFKCHYGNNPCDLKIGLKVRFGIVSPFWDRQHRYIFSRLDLSC